MATWQKIADTLKTDPALTQLDLEHVEAIVDILMLTTLADATVAFMEEAEFEHLLHELPWIENKKANIDAYIESNTGRIKAINSDDEIKEFARKASDVLTDQDVRVKAYHMAVAIAGADMNIHTDEHKVLTWIADIFEIPESKRAIL